MRPKSGSKKNKPLWSRAAGPLQNAGPANWRGRAASYALYLWPPLLALALAGLLAFCDVFWPLYPWVLALAGVWALLWIWRAAAGVTGFWVKGTHGGFALGFIALLALGGSWGPWGTSEDLRVWVTPPAYTLRPTTELPVSGGEVLAGSLIHIGAKGGKPMDVIWQGETQLFEPEGDEESTLSLQVDETLRPHAASLTVLRRWQRLGFWSLQVIPDAPPVISWSEPPEVTGRKTIRLAYDARDDFSVETILVRAVPVTTEQGQSSAPVEIALTSPRTLHARGVSYADLTALPWAGQEVRLQLVALDGAGQRSLTVGKSLKLPSRKFRNPFARALIEERQRLLEDDGAALRNEAANVMAGIARQQGLFRSDAALYLSLRAGAVRLVLDNRREAVLSAAQTLWLAALNLEEGLLGQTRAALAQGLQDYAQGLARSAQASSLEPLTRALRDGARLYYAALDDEKARQPEALREMNWLPLEDGQPIWEEDFLMRIERIGLLAEEGKTEAAQVRLSELQNLVENLRTLPPELSPTQDRLAQQVASLRALVRGQKQVGEETAGALAGPAKTYKEKQERAQGLSRAIARQQALLGALEDLLRQFPDARVEIKDSVRAMLTAVAALRGGQGEQARRQQAQAQALLENSVLVLSEKMKQSLTASGL